MGSRWSARTRASSSTRRATALVDAATARPRAPACSTPQWVVHLAHAQVVRNQRGRLRSCANQSCALRRGDEACSIAQEESRIRDHEGGRNYRHAGPHAPAPLRCHGVTSLCAACTHLRRHGAPRAAFLGVGDPLRRRTRHASARSYLMSCGAVELWNRRRAPCVTECLRLLLGTVALARSKDRLLETQTMCCRWFASPAGKFRSRHHLLVGASWHSFWSPNTGSWARASLRECRALGARQGVGEVA